MTQFILKINLGNEAIQTGMDISRVLSYVASEIQDYENLVESDPCKENIRDLNGNTVGSWELI